MGGKRNGLACILTGIGTGILMLLLLYTVCPLFDTDIYMLFFKGAGKGAAGRVTGLFMLVFPPLIPPAASIISMRRKDKRADVLINIFLAGIIAFILQVLYVLLRLQ